MRFQMYIYISEDYKNKKTKKTSTTKFIFLNVMYLMKIVSTKYSL